MSRFREAVSKLSSVRSAATFARIEGYRNEHGGLANYTFVFHFSYEGAVKRSIDLTREYVPVDETVNGRTILASVMAQAKTDQIASWEKTLAGGHDRPCHANFEPVTKNVRLHTCPETGVETLHAMGFCTARDVIEEGDPRPEPKGDLPFAKEILRKRSPLGRLIQVKLTEDRFTRLAVGGFEILPPDVADIADPF